MTTREDIDAKQRAADLKPCPFCGGKARIGSIRDGMHAYCQECHAAGAPAFHGPGRKDNPLDTDERARAAWNTRATDQAIEALRIALDEYECNYGRLLNPNDPHWSNMARSALASLTGEVK